MNRPRSTPLGGDGRPETAYGVDGCRAGWFYIALVPCQEAAWDLVETVGELVAGAGGSDRILVDTPIGLPDGPEGRVCDTEARARLGWPRASSVFPAPVRAALPAATYVEARRINCKASGKGLTRQTFGILPGIREVNLLLQEGPKAQTIVRETHPEICFWALAGGSPMEHGKVRRRASDLTNGSNCWNASARLYAGNSVRFEPNSDPGTWQTTTSSTLWPRPSRRQQSRMP